MVKIEGPCPSNVYSCAAEICSCRRKLWDRWFVYNQQPTYRCTCCWLVCVMTDEVIGKPIATSTPIRQSPIWADPYSLSLYCKFVVWFQISSDPQTESRPHGKLFSAIRQKGGSCKNPTP